MIFGCNRILGKNMIQNMRSQGSRKRVALGEISNQVQAFESREEKGVRIGGKKGDGMSEMREMMGRFYEECHAMLDTNQREIQQLLSRIELQSNQCLLGEFLRRNGQSMPRIKQSLARSLKEMSEYSFIDKKEFRSGRGVGVMELKSFTDTPIDIKTSKHYDLHGIKGLKMSNIILTTPEIKQITLTLPHLEQLTLFECAIDDDGAGIIAESLPRLHKLQLGWNLVGNPGAKDISLRLKRLRHLDLYLNNIGDEGAKLLVNNLKSLETLNLEDNDVSVSMRQYVASVLDSYNS